TKERPTRSGKCWARDRSWRVIPEWEGATVTKVEVRHWPSPGLDVKYPRVRITVRAEDDLAAGDILLHRGEAIGVVGRLVPDDEMPCHGGRRADLMLPRSVGGRLGLKADSAVPLFLGKRSEPPAISVLARTMNEYSTITKQPLVTSACLSTTIRTKHIAWLQSRGLFANLAELTSLKSDDMRNRSFLRGLLELGDIRSELIPEPAAPE